jgi:hypothetical protein
MKMLMPGMSKIVAVAAVCVVAWSFNAAAALANLAKGKTVTASSFEKPGMEGSKITDDDTSTKWGSKFDLYDQNSPLRDSAWFYIDFGAQTTFDSLIIYWEHSTALIYNIQTTTAATPTANDQGWTTISEITNEKYPLNYDDQHTPCYRRIKYIAPVSTRYLKVRCIKRNYEWGFSVWEMKVFNVSETGTVNGKKITASGSSGLILNNTKNGSLITLNGTKSKDLSAEILSPQGQLIRRLNGSKTIQWNYKDSLGRDVMNGTYLLKVTSAGTTFQDKITVQR